MTLDNIVLTVCAGALSVSGFLVVAIVSDIREQIRKIADRVNEHETRLTVLERTGGGLCVMLLAGALATGCATGANQHAQAHDKKTVTIETVELAGAPAKTWTPDRVKLATTTETKTRDRVTGQQPPTGRQVFGLWLGKASAVAAIALIILLVLSPSTVAAFALRRYFAFRRAFVETVAGIEAYKAAGHGDAALKNSLRAAQSTDTRQLVTRAKTEA